MTDKKSQIILIVIAVIFIIAALIFIAVNKMQHGGETVYRNDTVVVKQYDTIYAARDEVRILWKKSGPVMVTEQRDTVQRKVENILTVKNDDNLQLISKRDSTIKRYDFGKISARGFELIADSNNIILKKQMIWLQGPEAFVRYEFKDKKKFIGTRLGVNYDDNYRLTGAVMYEPGQKETKIELEFSYKINF